MKKVTFVLKLNALLIVVCVVFFSVNNVSAQIKKREIYGNRIEKKADKCNYIIYEQGERYVLHNKNNSLMVYESSFTAKTNYQLNLDKIIKFPDREKIDPLFYKTIAPFYKDYKSKYHDKVNSFDMILYAKPDGTVCELTFSVSQDAMIPLKVIEKLEEEILSLGAKLEFDPNDYHIKDAIWVNYRVGYSVFRMKEKWRAEKEH